MVLQQWRATPIATRRDDDSPGSKTRVPGRDDRALGIAQAVAAQRHTPIRTNDNVLRGVNPLLFGQNGDPALSG